MRKAGKIAAETLDYIEPYVKVGCTTNALDSLCHEFIVNAGAIPAPLGYRGYPKSICTSRNSVVCHGIPNEKPLLNGDILNIDVTVMYNGWHGDTSRMFLVGDVPIKSRLLCFRTYEILMKAISILKPNIKLSEIGRVIETEAKKYGYSVVRGYCGHGLGRKFHDAPSVCHFYDPSCDIVLKKGMFFTIEPMLNIGKADTVLSKHDGWTVTTKDFSMSAQFEHSIGILDDCAEIFTLSPSKRDNPCAM